MAKIQRGTAAILLLPVNVQLAELSVRADDASPLHLRPPRPPSPARVQSIAAAAAVLFAVNITAVIPATPANLGVFQAACATVLHTGWHVGWGAGVAYGVILQAVEVSTAILMGAPALVKEGMSWREVRLRAMHATPVKLPARPHRPAPARRATVTHGSEG